MPESDPRSGSRWSWVLVALTAACVEPIAVKLGYRAAATPWQTLLVRNAIAALVILPLTRGPKRVPLREGARLVAAGALLFCTSLLTLFALARLTVAVVISIVSLTPVVVTLASRRAVGARFAAGVACGVAGAALATLATNNPSARAIDPVGLACAIGAVATSTIYRLTLEKVTAKHAPPVVSAWVFATCGLLTLVLVAPFAGLPPAAAWWAGGWTGVAAAIANVTFVAVVRALGAARASLVMLLQRPLVVTIAWAWLGERPGVLEVAGVGLVLFGVWLGGQTRAPVVAVKS